eukprot:scaffold48726_cov32-Phaeocystis_antarctica.AAC.2
MSGSFIEGMCAGRYAWVMRGRRVWEACGRCSKLPAGSPPPRSWQRMGDNGRLVGDICGRVATCGLTDV